MVTCRLKDGWYDIAKDDRKAMPKRFALGVVDGPPPRPLDRVEYFIDGDTILLSGKVIRGA